MEKGMKVSPSRIDDWDAVLRALSALYETYYKVDSNVPRQREEVERELANLMIAYNAYLG